jgi:hypothetical protein
MVQLSEQSGDVPQLSGQLSAQLVILQAPAMLPHCRLQLLPGQSTLHVAALSQFTLQPPPAHVMSQVAPPWHLMLQLPSGQSKSHVSPSHTHCVPATHLLLLEQPTGAATKASTPPRSRAEAKPV